MVEVYRARDMRLGRDAPAGVADDPARRQRFELEAIGDPPHRPAASSDPDRPHAIAKDGRILMPLGSPYWYWPPGILDSATGQFTQIPVGRSSRLPCSGMDAGRDGRGPRFAQQDLEVHSHGALRQPVPEYSESIWRLNPFIT
jgi:hypothetical protein